MAARANDHVIVLSLSCRSVGALCWSALVLRSADDSGLTRRSAGVRTARGDAREGAAFLPPAVGRKRAPAAGVEVRHLPADRLVLRVDRLVVIGEQLEAVPVGIAQIDEARVARTEVAARSPFDTRAES